MNMINQYYIDTYNSAILREQFKSKPDFKKIELFKQMIIKIENNQVNLVQ